VGVCIPGSGKVEMYNRRMDGGEGHLFIYSLIYVPAEAGLKTSLEAVVSQDRITRSHPQPLEGNKASEIKILLNHMKMTFRFWK
jgi:hypothetical protein